MRIKLSALAAGLFFTTPVFAQNNSGIVTLPNYDFSTSTMAWSYYPGGNRPSATQVLAQLRDRCDSTSQYDRYYCRRGMKVLNKAYEEYKLRMAAKNSVAQ